jgi:hypothetical protein
MTRHLAFERVHPGAPPMPRIGNWSLENSLIDSLAEFLLGLQRLTLAITIYLRIPVYEGSIRVVLPCPDVQLKKSVQVVPVRARDQLEQLAIE